MPNPEASVPAMEGSCLSFRQKFTYSLGQMSVSLSPALIASWLIYYYTGRLTGASKTPLLLVSAVGMSMGGLIPRLLEAIAEPIVGHLSDKWRFRGLRRMPWIVLGTPILAAFSLLIWFPPDADGAGRVYASLLGLDITPNFLWLVFTHTGFWFLYTAVVIPYLSLLPEITPYVDERIRVSEFMAYSDVAGTVLGSLGLGLMIDAFAGGGNLFGIHLTDGFQVSGFLIAAVFTLSFYASVSIVRERPSTETVAVDFHFGEAVRESFRNKPFPPYVIASAAIRMGVDVVLASVPFLVAVVMGLSEGLAGILQGVIVLGAAFLFPLVSRMAENRGKKGIFLLGLGWFAVAMALLSLVRHAPIFGWPVAWIAGLFGKPFTAGQVGFAHACFVLALCAFPVSIVFVLQRPILSDVIDADEKRTGYRREAMYNGMEGLISKPASGAAYFIVPLLNGWLGATIDRPYGILAAPVLAGAILALGFLGFRKYPITR
jgi:GPH family glycoside/pentoside/hexuronide:cation symporter